MKQLLDERAGEVAIILKNSTYLTSIGLISSAAFDFLNNNIGVVGAGLGLATFMLNYYFNKKKLELDTKYKQKDYELRAKSLKRRSDDL